MSSRTLTVLAALLTAWAWPVFAQTPLDAESRAGWLADLDQLRDSMTARYPNLEWQVERGLDLGATYKRARGRIETAADVPAARRALERFIATFGDGHLGIAWPSSRASGGSPPSPPTLCERLGYFDAGDQGAIAPRLSSYRAVGRPDAHFRAGIVSVGGKRVGVLRAPIFEPQGFPDICETLMRQEGLKADSPCDDTCADRLGRRADAVLVNEMRSQLQAVAAEHPDSLLLDLADNGGGNASALALTAMVTARPVVQPRARIIGGEVLAREVASRQTDVKAGLASASAPQRTALTKYAADLDRVGRAALSRCDRSPLWRGEPIGCTSLVDDARYEGPLPPRSADGTPSAPWAEVVSPVARFPPTPPIWKGPLLVLVDGNSASATELLAAILQDGHAAVILGAATYGSGCGHMTSAEPLVLAHSRASVSMPDCLRLRADGTNEMSGVTPDVYIPLRTSDTPKQRVERLARALPVALARATTPTPRPGSRLARPARDRR